MFNLNSLVRDNIRNMEPYSNARSEFKGESSILLDANENPYGFNNRYPDPKQIELKFVMSKIINVDVDQIAIGNGSDELIDLILRIFCRPGIDKTLCFSPSYGMYKVCSQVNDVGVIEVPLDNSWQIDIRSLSSMFFNPLIKVIFICSPNNPTGNLIKLSTIDFILKGFSGIVVVDEAYIDFSESESSISLLDRFPNLIVLRTLSKAWGLAAARIGFAFADVEIISLIDKVKAPYNIGGLNQKAAIDILKQKKVVYKNIEKLKLERDKLSLFLNNLNFVSKVFPSDSNYVLVEFIDSKAVYKFLIKRGIVVRDRSILVENCLRITIGLSKENLELINALKEFNSCK